MKVGITRLTRVRKKRSIWLESAGRRRGYRPHRRRSGRRRALLDVDRVEVVIAERAQLEAFHLLALDCGLDAVGDGEPRRVLLEDDLGLLVELRPLLHVGRALRLADEIVERLVARSEEHTSELQSRENLVCR